jgi:uncharacterized protein YndB with AHSA1/START domain
MQERSVTHSTFVIERSYPAATERVFAAFSDPTKQRRWFAEDKDFKAETFEMDFRVGGATAPVFARKASRAPTTRFIATLSPTIAL